MPGSDAQRPPFLLLGEVLRPHGVAGEVKMRVLTAYPERLTALKTVYIGRDPESPDITPYRLDAVRFHQSYALLKLHGVNDRNQAELLRDRLVMVAIDEAIPLEAGEVYLYQLIGMTVVADDGRDLGTVVDVLETGANDVYVVNGPQYGEVLIPVTPETVVHTDTDARRITVRLPEGLLPDR